MKFNDVKVASYRAYRMPYPPATKAKTDMETSLSEGGPYVFEGTGGPPVIFIGTSARGARAARP
ncbi:MAG: hypothetical protein WCP45_12210 [Verrucomicrobiota bacterium]